MRSKRTFGLKWILVAVALSAVFCATLIRPNNFWYETIHAMAFFSVGISLVGVCVLKGKSRAFAIGFFVLGFARFVFERTPIHISRQTGFKLFPSPLLLKLVAWLANPQDQKWAVITIPYLSVLTSGLIGGAAGYLFAIKAHDHDAVSRPSTR